MRKRRASPLFWVPLDILRRCARHVHGQMGRLRAKEEYSRLDGGNLCERASTTPTKQARRLCATRSDVGQAASLPGFRSKLAACSTGRYVLNFVLKRSSTTASPL